MLKGSDGRSATMMLAKIANLWDWWEGLFWDLPYGETYLPILAFLVLVYLFGLTIKGIMDFSAR
jgi:hypothetical protein